MLKYMTTDPVIEKVGEGFGESFRSILLKDRTVVQPAIICLFTLCQVSLQQNKYTYSCRKNVKAHSVCILYSCLPFSTPVVPRTQTPPKPEPEFLPCTCLYQMSAFITCCLFEPWLKQRLDSQITSLSWRGLSPNQSLCLLRCYEWTLEDEGICRFFY